MKDVKHEIKKHVNHIIGFKNLICQDLKWHINHKSSHLRCSVESCSLKCYKIHRKTHAPEPPAYNFIKKETLAQVFSCEFCEISKNTFPTEHLWATASVITWTTSQKHALLIFGIQIISDKHLQSVFRKLTKAIRLSRKQQNFLSW